MANATAAPWLEKLFKTKCNNQPGHKNKEHRNNRGCIIIMQCNVRQMSTVQQAVTVTTQWKVQNLAKKSNAGVMAVLGRKQWWHCWQQRTAVTAEWLATVTAIAIWQKKFFWRTTRGDGNASAVETFWQCKQHFSMSNYHVCSIALQQKEQKQQSTCNDGTGCHNAVDWTPQLFPLFLLYLWHPLNSGVMLPLQL